MLKLVLLCLLIFVITAAETLVSTWEGRADRQSTSARHNRFSKKAAFWATVFEAILFLDIIMVSREGWYLLGPILLGAYVSKYWALERRRRRFRSRTKKPTRRKREAPAAREEVST